MENLELVVSTVEWSKTGNVDGPVIHNLYFTVDVIYNSDSDIDIDNGIVNCSILH